MSQSVTATFLFTDLVGSTQLASSMSAVQADELRKRHFALLRAAVESTGGREVKNLGDGLMIVFSSASRAFSCAVEIQQALDRHNRRGDTVLEVRIGLATGEAIEEEGDFFGDPVVEAARLCALAAPGQILATELLRLTVGRHTSLEFVPLGPVELKGLPAPVPAVEARWEPAREDGPAGVPLPVRLAHYASGGLFGFSGRDPELALLTELRKQASTERRLGVALVAGEPGVGKSCLAAHAAHGAHGEGVTVLFGECAEGSHAPYLPWMGALSHLVRHAEPTTLAATLSGPRLGARPASARRRRFSPGSRDGGGRGGHRAVPLGPSRRRRPRAGECGRSGPHRPRRPAVGRFLEPLAPSSPLRDRRAHGVPDRGDLPAQ